MDNLNDTISKYTDNWFNHLTHMDHSRFPRYMLPYEPSGKRGLGRPRKRWMNRIWGAATDDSLMQEEEEEETSETCIIIRGFRCGE